MAIVPKTVADLRHVQSTFSQRLTQAEIRDSYRSADEAFTEGDYLVAARYPGASPELTGCALAFSGHVVKAAEILATVKELSTRGILAYGFTLWSLRQNELALSILARVEPTDPDFTLAAALRELVAAREIPAFVVAAHTPVFASVEDDTLRPSFRCGQFSIKHVASQFAENAYDYDPGEPFDKFLDSLPAEKRPLFVYAATPQWFLPKDFSRANVAKIMWAHDSDCFFHRDHQRYLAFDDIIVSTSQEHYELSRPLGVACHSNLFSDPLLRMPTPRAAPQRDKPIDVLFSGAAAGGLTPEKNQFIFELAELADDYKIVVIDGHLPEDEYLQMLSTAKFLPIVNRYYGNPSPRWRDALSSYTYVLSPKDVPYEELCRGFFPIDQYSIAEGIRGHLVGFRQQDSVSAYEMQGAFSDIRLKFPPSDRPRSDQFERNLKFCAYLALARRHRGNTRARPAVESRHVWLTPQIDCLMYGRPNIASKIKGMIDSLSLDDCRSASAINDFAMLSAQLGIIYHDRPEYRAHQGAVGVSILERGIGRYPSSLVLRYNRAHWRFMFGICPLEESISDFGAVIDALDELDFSPLDDDLGLGYAGYTEDRVFPSSEYGQLLTSCFADQAALTVSPEILALTKRIIHSTLMGLIGWAHAKNGDVGRAIENFDEALAAYGENLPLHQLSLDTSLQALEAGNSDLREATIRTFYAAANLNPALLSSHALRIMPFLKASQGSGQVSALLGDWYKYTRVFKSVGGAAPLRSELPLLTEVLTYKASFPARMRRDTKLRRAYHCFRTGGLDLGAKLAVAPYYRMWLPWGDRIAAIGSMARGIGRKLKLSP